MVDGGGQALGAVLNHGQLPRPGRTEKLPKAWNCTRWKFGQRRRVWIMWATSVAVSDIPSKLKTELFVVCRARLRWEVGPHTKQWLKKIGSGNHGSYSVFQEIFLTWAYFQLLNLKKGFCSQVTCLHRLCVGQIVALCLTCLHPWVSLKESIWIPLALSFGIYLYISK